MTPTILVVDDDQDVCQLLARLLGMSGYQVVQAHDGAAALSLAHRERPDLVLTDLAMPDMDGLALAARLRSAGFAGAIVLMSAGWDDSPLPEFPFVAKPFDLPRLLETLAAQLERGRPAEGRAADRDVRASA